MSAASQLFADPQMPRTGGIVGGRQLVCVQTIDIARLTAHPVALVPGAFVAVGGRGPKGDSNESGKTSFLAAVSLLLGDPEWRLGGGGAASVAALLFEPETAGAAGQRFAPAQHGYVVGVFAEDNEPQSTALTVWCRLGAIAPHVVVRWQEGVHLAPGETDAERHLNADETWRSLSSKHEAGAASYAAALYGDAPRVLAYVAKRGSQRSDPSLLQMNAGAFPPHQIGADLIRLTGRAGSFDSDAQQRQQLDTSERKLHDREAHDQDARRQEDVTLAELGQRQQARTALGDAEHLWSLHFARGYLDVLKTRADLEEQDRGQEELLAAAREQLTLATVELARFDAPDELERQLQEAANALARVRAKETSERQAVSDARALVARLQDQLDPERSIAVGWSRTPLEACTRRLAAAVETKEARTQTLWAASEAAQRAETMLKTVEAGGEGTADILRALEDAGVAAAALLDIVEVEEGARADWEPRLRLYANAVLVRADEAERARATLVEAQEAVLIIGTASDYDSPRGISAAPAHALGFLKGLADRYQAGTGPVASATDAELGVVVIDQHEEPQTGRANRIARAAAARQAATLAVEQATAAHRAALLELEEAQADRAAGEATARIADLESKIERGNDQVRQHEVALEGLAPQLDAVDEAFVAARVRVDAYETAKERASAFVELRESQLGQAQRALDATRRQKEALQVEYWKQGWGDSAPAGELALADEARTENTLRRRAGDALLEALNALGVRSDGSGAPTEDLARVARRRDQLIEDPVGRQPPSFDTIVAPLRDWLDSHGERDTVIAERIERTRAQREAEINLVRSECSELHDGLISLQDAVEQRVRQSLDEISAAFDGLSREAGGFGAELAIKTYRPRSAQESWRWEVTPGWRRSPQGRMLPYDSQMNTAQEKLFTVHLVLAALLAAPNPQGRVLIIDELGDSLGINHRREVLRAIAATAREKSVLVLGTCQDSVLADAATFCDEILYFECPTKTDALNRPTRMLGFDENGDRVELAAEQILAGRQLV